MKREPLTIINFVHKPWSFSETPYKLYFTIRGPELDSKKCKRLVSELESRLKSFSHEWDGIKCSCSDLDDFFFYRANENTQVNGGYHSFGIHSCFLSKDEDTRRKDMGRVTSLLNKELRTLRFAHYKTSLRITSVEPK